MAECPSRNSPEPFEVPRVEGGMEYLEEMFSLSGKTVVLTGGGGVLAGAIAEALLRAGANISLWGVHAESVSNAAERLKSISDASERIGIEIADAASESAIGNALQSTVARFGSLDVLINAVGGTKGKCSFIDTEIEQFKKVLELNLIAGLLVPTKIVCQYWLSRQLTGSVINMASMGSFIPLSGVWAYDAAKAGILNLTMATAKEFAPHRIRVNAIAPGFFIGKQNRALLLDEHTGDLTQRGKDVISRTPCRRFGDPRDLAGVILFLASEQAAGFITGACIPVDGGFLVDWI
jgi:NAD(P)-dependent dehydrogenase (short-subunit alcohol dehydrogenase family)